MPVKYPFIGDLSEADVGILVAAAESRSRVLEFGVGGSTLLFAQAMCSAGTLISVDTELNWISATEKKLRDVGAARVQTTPIFKRLDEDWALPNAQLVFVDGCAEGRRPFALTAWPMLKPGGVMIFHDTRRLCDVQNVTALCETYFEEVGDVLYNARGSNMTLVGKRIIKATYENWNVVERKEPWMFGLAEPPAGWADL